jgi:hypothetical protein
LKVCSKFQVFISHSFLVIFSFWNHDRRGCGPLKWPAF